MAKIECPKCKRKSLNHRKTYDDYVCDHRSCEAIFNKDLKEMHVKGKNLIKDDFGNYYKVEVTKEEGIIKHIKTFYLEPNKSTLRGEYKKFRRASDCKYPERLSCNHGIGFNRCEYMKYRGSLGNWNCNCNIKNKEV